LYTIEIPHLCFPVASPLALLPFCPFVIISRLGWLAEPSYPTASSQGAVFLMTSCFEA